MLASTLHTPSPSSDGCSAGASDTGPAGTEVVGAALTGVEVAGAGDDDGPTVSMTAEVLGGNAVPATPSRAREDAGCAEGGSACTHRSSRFTTKPRR